MPLVFDKVKGHDSLRSSIRLAKDLGVLGGNRNGYYLGDNKDQKFRATTVHQDFNENRELYKILYGYIIPELEKNISSVKPEELINPDEEMDY